MVSVPVRYRYLDVAASGFPLTLLMTVLGALLILPAVQPLKTGL